MGSHKWGYKSLIWVIRIVTLLVTLLITTHEPPSRVALIITCTILGVPFYNYSIMNPKALF